MRLCFLLPVLALALPAFGQIGLYGPITTHLKAGDTAPDIRFTSLLSAPVSGSWSQANLTGQLTVLIFFPLTSHNPQPVSMWNATVEKFSGKPVQFLFITGEKEATLKPWLNDHPIKGWVFLDSRGKTGNAYGLEQPVTVYIGPDRKILGFSNFPMADEQTINAALEHRITTTRPTQANIKAFLASNQVVLEAEPRRMPRPDDNKPNFPPSYEVHISPSQGDDRMNSSSDSYWSLRGTSLKEAIQYVYGNINPDSYSNINPIRILLPESLDNDKHYDFSLVLPAPESREKMIERFQQGIQNYFHLTARRESRLIDVYIVTADPNHTPPPVEPRAHNEMGYMRSSGVEFQTVTKPGEKPADALKPESLSDMSGISADGTADELCHTLENALDRPVVNETNLQGQYKFQVKSSDGPQNDFLQHLHDQLGLTITPAQRQVELLIFTPQN